MHAQDAGDFGQHAGPVLDREPQVVPPRKLFVVEHLHAGLALRPEVERAEGDAGAANRGVDHIGDDGRGGRHLAGAQAVEEDRPDGIAHHADRIERLPHFSQRRADLDQGGRDVEFQAVVELGDGDQLDAVAQLLGVPQVGRVEGVDADSRNLAPVDAGPERQVRQDRQLLGRVAAADVHRRIGLGITEALRFL
jgi:hypothetical protein